MSCFSWPCLLLLASRFWSSLYPYSGMPFFLFLYIWFNLVTQILVSLSPHRALPGTPNQIYLSNSYFLFYFNDLHCTDSFLTTYFFVFLFFSPSLLPYFQWECKFYERGSFFFLFTALSPVLKTAWHTDIEFIFLI